MALPSVAYQRRAYGLLGLISSFFSCSIFVASSEPIGLKFGHNAWIGPEEDNKDFHRDSFCSFYIKNKNRRNRDFPLKCTGIAISNREQAINNDFMDSPVAQYSQQQLGS